MASTGEIDPKTLPERLESLPGVAELRAAAGDRDVYLVGGAVRDLLLGAERADLDVVVERDARGLAAALGGELVEHERFSTAKVALGDDLDIDIARARTETYPQPGALPEVQPADVETDLGRRDFTINAMAVPITGDDELIDPHGGLEDLRAGVLRVLHDDSFSDDPTRGLRAARYAARLGFALDPHTEELLREADLSTVSEDRVTRELERTAFEERPSSALTLMNDWGLLDLGKGPRLAAAIERLHHEHPSWDEFADRGTTILAAVAPGEHAARLRARAAKLAKHPVPGSPAQIQVLAKDHVPFVLAMARAAGSTWLDEYVDSLRHVELEIDGYDLLEAGAPQGAAVGIGLNAALNAKLDGDVDGYEDELRIAMDAIGSEAAPPPPPDARAAPPAPRGKGRRRRRG